MKITIEAESPEEAKALHAETTVLEHVPTCVLVGWILSPVGIRPLVRFEPKAVDCHELAGLLAMAQSQIGGIQLRGAFDAAHNRLQDILAEHVGVDSR